MGCRYGKNQKYCRRTGPRLLRLNLALQLAFWPDIRHHELRCGLAAASSRPSRGRAWTTARTITTSPASAFVEEQNGSAQSIKDHVWGLSYVDEAAQTRVNTNPTGHAELVNYYHLQDANFNEVGLIQLQPRAGGGVTNTRLTVSGRCSTPRGSGDTGCYSATNQSAKVWREARRWRMA